MSYLSKVVPFLTALCVFSRGDACVDKLPDCADYTKSSCQGPYVSWAYENCRAFCGFCHNECENNRSDCHEFGKEMCLEPYKTWANANCAKYCGFCGPEFECLFTPWADITPCSRTCGGGFKAQVRAFTLVPKGTPLAKNCSDDLYRNTTCNLLVSCPTSGPSPVVEKVPGHSLVDATTKAPVEVPVPVPVVDTDHSGHHTNIDPVDVVTGVAAAGTAAAGGIALGALLSEILPVFAFSFLGKRDINEDRKAMEDVIQSVLKSQMSDQ